MPQPRRVFVVHRRLEAGNAPREKGDRIFSVPSACVCARAHVSGIVAVATSKGAAANRSLGPPGHPRGPPKEADATPPASFPPLLSSLDARWPPPRRRHCARPHRAAALTTPPPRFESAGGEHQRRARDNGCHECALKGARFVAAAGQKRSLVFHRFDFFLPSRLHRRCSSLSFSVCVRALFDCGLTGAR